MQSTDNHESRRQFLQQQLAASAVTAASLSFASGVHAQESESDAKAASDKPIRMALVGCGGRGTGAVNDSLTINHNVHLVALADLTMDKCEQTRKAMSGRHGQSVAVADDKMYAGLDAYKQVLEDPDIDLVLLTTSPGFRPRHVRDAVDAGKHVFAEKPVCVDPAGYQICLSAHEKAEQQGTAIVTGTQYRRQANYVEAVKQLRAGAIGDIIGATARYCTNGTWFKNRKDGMSDLDYQLYNWMHFIWLSGDQIAEQAVHNIDALNWVMGSPPQSAYGSGGRFTRPEGSEMWDSMSIDYHYPGERVLSFVCRQIPGSAGDNGNVIYGSDAIMHIDAMSSGSRILDREGKVQWSCEGSLAEAYKQEHKELVDSIRAEKPIVELKQTAESSLTAVMGRLAAYTGKRVTWDFVTNQSTLDLFPKDFAENFPGSQGHAIPGVTKLT